MIVKELRELLKNVDDDVQILIPMTHEFDGSFYSPCYIDSGLSTMGKEDLTEEDINEMQLLDKALSEEDTFLLLPCGFGEKKDHSHELN